MSKELIDRLKSYIPSGDGHNSQYANDLADAVAVLEAKAVPVGKLREAFEAWMIEVEGVRIRPRFDRVTAGPFADDYRDGQIQGAWNVWQACAAYQRQQAREVVIPTLVVKESGEWGNAYERGFKAALREFARLNGGSHE